LDAIRIARNTMEKVAGATFVGINKRWYDNYRVD